MLIWSHDHDAIFNWILEYALLIVLFNVYVKGDLHFDLSITLLDLHIYFVTLRIDHSMGISIFVVDWPFPNTYPNGLSYLLGTFSEIHLKKALDLKVV